MYFFACDVDMQVTKIFLIDPFYLFAYMSSVSRFLHIVSIELTRSQSILLLKLTMQCLHLTIGVMEKNVDSCPFFFYLKYSFKDHACSSPYTDPY